MRHLCPPQPVSPTPPWPASPIAATPVVRISGRRPSLPREMSQPGERHLAATSVTDGLVGASADRRGPRHQRFSLPEVHGLQWVAATAPLAFTRAPRPVACAPATRGSRPEHFPRPPPCRRDVVGLRLMPPFIPIASLAVLSFQPGPTQSPILPAAAPLGLNG
jgi:hypothetical protein